MKAPGTELLEVMAVEMDIPLWRARLASASGAELEIELERSRCALQSARSLEGGIDYDLDPGMNMIKLSAARQTALAFRPGEVQAWRLTLRNDWQSQRAEWESLWAYRFEYPGNIFVNVDAFAGRVIQRP